MKALKRLDRLRHGLQTAAFCLVIAAVHYAFMPGVAYEVPLVYSLGIGLSTWLLIELGASVLPSARETGWPKGPAIVLLPLLSIGLGYVIGTSLGDWVFGWSTWASRSQRQIWLSALISTLIGVAITYYFFSRGKSQHLQRQVDHAQQLALEARLKLLESQLEPHMLFNTLANLRVLIGVDAARAQSMLDHIIAYLRATLDASRSGTHTLAQEFARLGDYLELMAIRMGPRLQFSLDLPAELAKHPVPALLLQPLVENAISHGLEPKVEGGSLCVRAQRQGTALLLEVSDTGLGFDADSPAVRSPAQHGHGFGLTQVRDRLAARYGMAGTLTFVANSSGGTRASVHFPYSLTETL